MSRLYASIDADASKTQATRRGYKHIEAHVRGWNDGVRVVASVDDREGMRGGVDVFDVFRTSGSNASQVDVWIGRIVGGRFIGASFPHDLEPQAPCPSCGQRQDLGFPHANDCKAFYGTDEVTEPDLPEPVEHTPTTCPDLPCEHSNPEKVTP